MLKCVDNGKPSEDLSWSDMQTLSPSRLITQLIHTGASRSGSSLIGVKINKYGTAPTKGNPSYPWRIRVVVGLRDRLIVSLCES